MTEKRDKKITSSENLKKARELRLKQLNEQKELQKKYQDVLDQSSDDWSDDSSGSEYEVMTKKVYL